MDEQPMTGLQLMGLAPPGPAGEVPPGEVAVAVAESEHPDTVSRETVFTAPMMTGWTWGADCTGTRAGLLWAKTPVIWPYVTGSEGVMWTEEEIQRFRDAGAKVYLVNQGRADLPFLGDEFDVEAGAISEADIIKIIQARRERQWSTRVYGTYGTYRDVTDTLVALGLRRSVWWRIADWNLSVHLAEAELWGDVYAGQWASPMSNPHTLLPGTGLTLEQAGADLNVVLRESTGWEG